MPVKDIKNFYYSHENLKIIYDDLKRFGAKVCSEEYLSMANDCEKNKPILQKFDAYGK